MTNTGNTAIVPQENSRAQTWRWVALLFALSQLAAPPVIARLLATFCRPAPPTKR